MLDTLTAAALCGPGLALSGLVGLGELLVARLYGGELPTGGVI